MKPFFFGLAVLYILLVNLSLADDNHMNVYAKDIQLDLVLSSHKNEEDLYTFQLEYLENQELKKVTFGYPNKRGLELYLNRVYLLHQLALKKGVKLSLAYSDEGSYDLRDSGSGLSMRWTTPRKKGHTGHNESNLLISPLDCREIQISGPHIKRPKDITAQLEKVEWVELRRAMLDKYKKQVSEYYNQKITVSLKKIPIIERPLQNINLKDLKEKVDWCIKENKYISVSLNQHHIQWYFIIFSKTEYDGSYKYNDDPDKVPPHIVRLTKFLSSLAEGRRYLIFNSKKGKGPIPISIEEIARTVYGESKENLSAQSAKRKFLKVYATEK